MPAKPVHRVKQGGKGQPQVARKVKKKAAVQPATQLASEYLKYFTSPQATPGGFHVFDLTDGSSVTTSSHT